MTHIRKVVLLISAVMAVALYIIVFSIIPPSTLRIIRLGQVYAFASVVFLYLALLISPLYAAFPTLPFKPLFVKARQSLGLSAFAFGAFHGYIEFFQLLGGFSGLPFLGTPYIIAITLSTIALTVLTLLALTSPRRMHAWLGAKWKILHRLVYAAGILIVIHALMLGSHFSDLSQLIPTVFISLLALLLILEALRVDQYLLQKFAMHRRFGIALPITILVLIAAQWYAANTDGNSLLNVHEGHISTSDRYAVEMEALDILPGKPVNVSFAIIDVETREPVRHFDIINEKILHLVIVDNELDQFTHVHPEFENGVFHFTHTFLKAHTYRLYFSFHPTESTEKQLEKTITVGSPNNRTPQLTSDDRVKIVNGYEITFKEADGVSLDALTSGTQTLTFTVAKEGKLVKTLKPYLGAFGHLVMIHEKTYQYVHVHPEISVSPTVMSAGPNVRFYPLALEETMQKGMYKLFIELNPNGTLIQTEFNLHVY